MYTAFAISTGLTVHFACNSLHKPARLPSSPPPELHTYFLDPIPPRSSPASTRGSAGGLNRPGPVLCNANAVVQDQLVAPLPIQDGSQRDWFAKQLRKQTVLDQEGSRERRAELSRQLSILIQQQDQLVNMRLNEEINADTYAAKATELRDRESRLKLQLDACNLGRHENAEIAIKAFELSQNPRAKWLTADYAKKRRVLEIVFLNFVLDDVTLVPETRKPFDMLAEGLLVHTSRGDRTPVELFLARVAGWEPYVERLLLAA